jgi:nicotinamidase-related amidase
MSAALIVVDVLNPYEHEDAELLMRSAARAVPPLSELIDGARDAGLLTVYVNDNHGDWSAGRQEIVERALSGPARELVEPILPPAGTPFLVKARHSSFYATQLEYLLREEGIQRLVLAGQVTEQCILYSALDGYVRGFEVVVPRNAVAHIDEDLADAALRMMQSNMHARIAQSATEALAAAAS